MNDYYYYDSDDDSGEDGQYDYCEGWWILPSDGSYARRIKQIVQRLRKNPRFKTTLTKRRSTEILMEECPYCEFSGDCEKYIIEGKSHIYQLCKIRSSSDIETTWIDISLNDRPEVRIGDKYGMLTVEEYGGYDKHGHPMWVVRCDCGNTKVIRGAHLLGGKTYSCGCQKGARNDLLTFGRVQSLYIEEEEEG